MTSGFYDSQTWLGSLISDLLDPPQRADIATTAQLWRIERVMILCDRRELMDDYPELSVRLRGAFGRRLKEAPSRRRRGWDIPPASVVLFDEIRPQGDEIPKPIVIRGHVRGDTLVVEISLFGWAGIYVDEAADAMMRALRQGIALGQDSRHRVPVVIREAGVARTEGINVPCRPFSATMTFRTPVTVRSSNRLRIAPSAIICSTVRRVAGLARWQGIVVEHNELALTSHAEALDYHEACLVTYRWRRHSQRGGDTPIPMAGQIGTLRIAGALTPLLPYLAIAAHTNTGSHAAIGLGWYDLFV